MSKLENILHNYDANEQRQDDIYAPLTSVIANSLDAYGIEINGLKNTIGDDGIYHKVIGSVDLNSLRSYVDTTTGTQFVFNNTGIPLGKNLKLEGYGLQSITTWAQLSNKMISRHPSDLYTFRVRNDSFSGDSALTDFMNAMKGVKLYYELATPIDTKIKLSTEYEVVGKSDCGSGNSVAIDLVKYTEYRVVVIDKNSTSNRNKFIVRFTSRDIDTERYNMFYNGAYFSSTANNGVQVRVGNTTIDVPSVFSGGSDKTSEYTFIVYGR